MKPESARFIDQANIILARADIMLGAGLSEDAAREAYLASFHMAQAHIFERTDNTFKTHRCVQREFLHLSRHDARVDQSLRRFSSQSYEFKSAADYFSGPSPVTSRETAAEAIATARRFVEHFSGLVPPPISSLPSPETG